jgi:hypothetical protein
MAHAMSGGAAGRKTPMTSAVYFNNPSEVYVDVSKKADGRGLHSSTFQLNLSRI